MLLGRPLDSKPPVATLLYRMRILIKQGVTKQLKQQFVLDKIFSSVQYLVPITFVLYYRPGCGQTVGREPHRTLAD
jgi:hypothetical protein